MFNILLILGWYIVYSVLTLGMDGGGSSFHLAFASMFPAVSLILYVMARKAILADEKMVRDADRIR